LGDRMCGKRGGDGVTAGAAAATIERADSVLLLIDFQERLMPAIAEGAAAAAKAIFLADTAQRLGVPIVVTEQNPRGLGPTLAGLAPHAAEPFAKRHFSAAREPNFFARMPAERRTVVVGGSEAHVCVLQTVLDLAAHGYAVKVATDAIGSRYPADKRAAIERMAARGIEMVTAEMVAFEWLATCDDPAFKPVIAGVKAL
jgi:nicotinamidase-related amidase